ncbi:DUF4227 family protein [Paenibacillus sp. NPDC058071]|uniref:DUF4227 family protein n=1 Tax=Paenibacillus sp. NPDC058071 TaxID=3346326 RepID=UPI0036DF0B6A
MVVSLRRWLSRLLFVILFALLLFIVTGGYRLLADAVSPIHPYKKPKGEALKVFQSEPLLPGKGSITDRLRLFYWYGE